MSKELQEIIKKRNQLEADLAEALVEEKRLTEGMVNRAGKNLFRQISLFAKCFKRGEARKLFDSVRDCLAQLESLDPNYMGVLGTAEPYGQKGTDENKFLISYLLGGAWREDTELWDVLEKVAGLRTTPGNLFLNEDERR